MNMMTAPRTLISGLLGYLRELAMVRTLRAIKLKAEADAHKVIQTRIIIGETLEEICNRKLLSHCLTSLM